MKARTTLELTINTNYVKNWGVWEAIREFIQNALDEHDKGNKCDIKYIKNTKVPQLRIVTNGTTINRDTLLLGTTNKSATSGDRGQFGEGMKLACLVLVRNGIKVKIRSGEEQWVPRIDRSSSFGADLLMVDTSPCAYRNKVQVDILGLTEHDWNYIKSNIMFLNGIKNKSYIEVMDDRILTGEEYKNKLFASGIYVGNLPGKYMFGYDIKNIELDRDRKMVDPWDLKYNIGNILNTAVGMDLISGDKIIDIINGGYDESNSISNYAGKNLNDVIVSYFDDKFGEDCIPVTDTTKSIEAQHYGLKTVVVPDVIANVVNSHKDFDMDRYKNEKKFEITNLFGVEELSEEEKDNFIWAIEKINIAEEVNNVSVVEFFDEDLQGLYKCGDIFISKYILKDKSKLIKVMIHEVAHKYGDDGTMEHEDAKDTISANILSKL